MVVALVGTIPERDRASIAVDAVARSDFEEGRVRVHGEGAEVNWVQQGLAWC